MQLFIKEFIEELRLNRWYLMNEKFAYQYFLIKFF